MKAANGDHARQPLAKGHDVIRGSRREFADGRDAAQQLVQRIELRAQFVVQFGMKTGAEQFTRSEVMTLA